MSTNKTLVGYKKYHRDCDCLVDGAHDPTCATYDDTPCAVCGAPYLHHPSDPIGNRVAVCFAYVVETDEAIDESDVRYCVPDPPPKIVA